MRFNYLRLGESTRATGDAAAAGFTFCEFASLMSWSPGRRLSTCVFLDERRLLPETGLAEGEDSSETFGLSRVGPDLAGGAARSR